MQKRFASKCTFHKLEKFVVQIQPAAGNQGLVFTPKQLSAVSPEVRHDKTTWPGSAMKAVCKLHGNSDSLRIPRSVGGGIIRLDPSSSTWDLHLTIPRFNRRERLPKVEKVKKQILVFGIGARSQFVPFVVGARLSRSSANLRSTYPLPGPKP